MLRLGEEFSLLEDAFSFRLLELPSARGGDMVSERAECEAGAAGPGAFPSNQPSGHWSHKLVQAMEDPALVVHSTAVVVTIRDKFPKARLHYLVLPRQMVENLQCLQRVDLALLLAMQQEAERLEAEHPDHQFQVIFMLATHQRIKLSRLGSTPCPPCPGCICTSSPPTWTPPA